MSGLIDKTQALTEALSSGIYTSSHQHDPNGSAAQQTAAYPRKGFEKWSKQDEEKRMKMQFVAQNNAQSPFGEIYASDSDLEWLRRKRDTEALANFDSWVGQNFHKDDVVMRKWLQEIHPQFYDVREKAMVDRAKVALRINLIKLRGIQSKEDLVLVWGLQTGRVQLDRDWDRIGPSKNAVNMEEEGKRFRKNLMGPWRYKTDDERAANAVGVTPGGSVVNNPFAPAEGPNEERQMQLPSPFAGGVVSGPQYPNFLRNALAPYL